MTTVPGTNGISAIRPTFGGVHRAHARTVPIRGEKELIMARSSSPTRPIAGPNLRRVLAGLLAGVLTIGTLGVTEAFAMRCMKTPGGNYVCTAP
jgi:hypothetical protein